MDIAAFVNNWIAVGNSYDLKKYLGFFEEDVIFDDPSVGRVFNGHAGVTEYFNSYFIGYKTQTELVKLEQTAGTAHLEVLFTGDFPEGKIGGTFDFTFRNWKIATVKADLIS